MPIRKTIEQDGTPVHVWSDDLDAQALRQLANVARLPFVRPHVAAMPDAHVGIGSTVGAVIPTVGAIVPAAVGVDIGCGMIATRLSLTAGDLPDTLRRVRSAIEDRVPVGFAMHDERKVRKSGVKRLARRFSQLLERVPELARMQKKPDTWRRQIGTLGGGNHFIELCLDESGGVWVMLHSGSRGIGNQIGRHFIALARERMLAEDARLPDRDLAWLAEGTRAFDDYLAAVEWAQDYATENRAQMLVLVLDALAATLPPFRVSGHAVDCHHNYVTRERHFGSEVLLTRKGAIRAGLGELGIIPGSMGARSFIVRGLGEPQSFSSCSHGAGRRLSRTQARQRYTETDLETQTAGVECRKDKGVLDEIPGAYKDIDQVMANQSDLVEVVHTLKQVVCVKG